MKTLRTCVIVMISLALVTGCKRQATAGSALPPQTALIRHEQEQQLEAKMKMIQFQETYIAGLRESIELETSRGKIAVMTEDLRRSTDALDQYRKAAAELETAMKRQP